ncbi:serine hydrolase domain-containing protein [Microbacterium koreense]|uniref:Serine hydrolase domain-containing protein n=1 Tax=Microbacterium koreense TaxID=323761 RepID=A0ABW2ZQZ7_9MICO
MVRPVVSVRRAAVAASLVAVLALVACVPADDERATPTESPVDGDLPVVLQGELQSVMEDTMTSFDVPGAVAGVWVPGEGAWTSAAGLADIAADVPATTEMSWPLRSITKSFTVTLLLQLVDEGDVSLDDTIAQYVDGVTDGDRITLRELAGMTSGNADYTGEAFLEDYTADPDRIFTLDDLNAFVLGQPAQFEPGAERIYTNANTNLIGKVVEAVTGMPFAEALDERILQPLGLDDTRYMVDVAEWTAPHAEGYVPEEEPREPVPQNFSIFGPAGSMVSTLADAAEWAEVLADGALLEPETQEERLVGGPLDAGPPYDLYALGIGETGGWWGHNGEGLGYTSAVFHEPTSGATIVVFANESNLPDHTHPADLMFRRMAKLLGEQGMLEG